MMYLIPLMPIVMMCLLLIVGCSLTHRLMNWLMMDMVSGMPRSPSMSANISKLMCINYMLLVLYLIVWIPILEIPKLGTPVVAMS